MVEVQLSAEVEEQLRQNALLEQLGGLEKTDDVFQAMTPAEQDGFGELLVSVANSLQATDVEGIQALGSVLSAFTNNAQDLTVGARTSVTDASGTLSQLLLENAATGLSAVCGDNTCAIGTEECLGCAADCGPCLAEETDTASASVVVQYQSGVSGFGSARITADIQGELVPSTVLTLEGLTAQSVPSLGLTVGATFARFAGFFERDMLTANAPAAPHRTRRTQ